MPPSMEDPPAHKSRCVCLPVDPTLQTRSLEGAPPILGRKHEPEVSTRDRRANTGADARIEEFEAIGEVRVRRQKISGDGVRRRAR